MNDLPENWNPFNESKELSEISRTYLLSTSDTKRLRKTIEKSRFWETELFGLEENIYNNFPVSTQVDGIQDSIYSIVLQVEPK